MLRFSFLAAIVFLAASCSGNKDTEEQIRYKLSDIAEERDTTNSVAGGLELSQINTYPQRVILNGMDQHRLVTIYKYIPKKDDRAGYDSYLSRGESWNEDTYEHYMPGIDLLFGYNLLNVAHYDMRSEKLNYLFQRPVLIKSVYYPSYVQDSVGKKPNRQPIVRDYFLISAYDEDTNGDTLLNRYDLRRFYHFNASCDLRTQIIPKDYSVVRSQYDYANDVMYIYARHDDNNNGKSEDTEALHVFWIDLKAPAPAKRMY